MLYQPLFEYIKQQLQQGVSQAQIKKILESNGWQVKDIEEGFLEYNKPAPTIAPPIAVQPNIVNEVSQTVNSNLVQEPSEPKTTIIPKDSAVGDKAVISQKSLDINIPKQNLENNKTDDLPMTQDKSVVSETIAEQKKPEPLPTISAQNKPELPAKKPNKFKLLLLILLGLFVLGGVTFFVAQDAIVAQLARFIPPEQTKQVELKLDILTTKDIFNIGEVFTGEYQIEFTGEPFKALVIYGNSKEGAAQSLLTKSFETINPGGVSENAFLQKKLKAFHITDVGIESNKESFIEVGKYQYSISIYSCLDLGLNNQECSLENVSLSKVLNDFKPKASASKVITVVENSEEPANEPTPTTPITSPAPPTGTSPVAPAPRESGQTSVLDCLRNNDLQCQLNYQKTFISNLEACKIAEGTVGIDLETDQGIFRGYRILGAQQRECQVDFWILDVRTVKNIPEFPVSLLNKQMRCGYFEDERDLLTVATGENCSGELLDEFRRVFR